MNRTEEFLDKYKQLEEAAIAAYGLNEKESAVYFLESRPEFRIVKSEIAYCREVRNLLAHKPKVEGDYAVEPSEGMITLLDKILRRVENPPTAMDIATKRDEMLAKGIEDYVKPTMIQMNDRGFSHVPILEDDIVVGVFSENTVLTCLIDGELIGDKAYKFNDIMKYLIMENHTSEKFMFIPVDMSLQEIGDIYERASKRNGKIGLIFVTENGKRNEKIKGIITAWDVAATK